MNDYHAMKIEPGSSDSWRMLSAFYCQAGLQRIEQVFHEGEVKCRQKFMTYFDAPNRVAYLMFARGRMAGLFWVDTFEGRMGRVHFMWLPWALRHSVRLGQFTARTFLEYKDPVTGEFAFDVLVGYIPTTIETAVKAAARSGAKRIGTIPLGSWIANQGRSVDTAVFAATREDVCI